MHQNFKLKYLTNWGFAPFIREQLKGEYITVSFDESLNEVTQTCQMCYDFGTMMTNRLK